MRTERILGILWIVIGALFGSMAVWRQRFVWRDVLQAEPLTRFNPWAYYFDLLVGPILLFGAVAGFFLCRGAQWARFGICAVGAVTAGIGAWEVATFSSFPFAEAAFGVFGLTSFALVCLPAMRKRRPTSHMQ